MFYLKEDKPASRVEALSISLRVSLPSLPLPSLQHDTSPPRVTSSRFTPYHMPIYLIEELEARFTRQFWGVNSVSPHFTSFGVFWGVNTSLHTTCFTVLGLQRPPQVDPLQPRACVAGSPTAQNIWNIWLMHDKFSLDLGLSE